MTTRGALFVALGALALGACGDPGRDAVLVGSKEFTEGILLGDMGTGAIRAAGIRAEHRRALGGTRILWEALLAGDIDAYPEYSGTLLEEIFADRPGLAAADLGGVLRDLGIGMTEPLGFENTYVLGVTRRLADEHDLESISDLRRHRDLRFGFSTEFMDRGDGWPALRRAYDLDPGDVRGLDHELAYRGLQAGSIDVIDLYSTDPEIERLGLVALTDDREHFPEYAGVFVYRLELEESSSTAVAALESLAGELSEDAVIAMNAAVELERRASSEVAGSFLESLGITGGMEVREPGRPARVAGYTRDHLILVAVSMLMALLTALPLGIVASRRRIGGGIILGAVGAIYTIPALALLVFMIPLLGIGNAPAIVALYLYSLLPIVRNTHAGLTGIPTPLLESAHALGLSDGAILRRIELPLASPAIMAGVKTAVVINIGTATLGALIGAGGLGQPILTGIRLADTGLILEGAVPAAALALAAQLAFDGLERWVVPKGLRLASG